MAEPAAEPVADEPGPAEPRVLAVVLAAVVVLAVLVVTVFVLLRSDDSGPAAVISRNDSVPEPPISLAPRTSYVDTRVTAGGDLVVRQWLHGSSQMFGVQLSVPPSVGPVRVTDVRVVAAGREVPGAETLRRGRGSYAFTGSEDVFLSYRVPGVVERSDSVPGRALAPFISLDARVSPRMVSTTYAVSGGTVLALACVRQVPDAVPVPCGAPAGRGWRVEREGDDRRDVVIAQLDLP